MHAPWVKQLLWGVKLLTLGLHSILATIDSLKYNRPGMAAVMGLAMVETLIISPISRGHYFMFLLPATLWVPLWLSRDRSRRWVIFLASAPGLLILTHDIGLHWIGRIGLLGIGMTVWYLVVLMDMLLMFARSKHEVEGVGPAVENDLVPLCGWLNLIII